jgi:thiol-disulfide isomerase/thioredoxin
MTNGNGTQANKRERQRARAEAKREAERKAEQRRMLGYGAAGIVLIAVVVIFVVALMGGDGSDGGDGGTPSAAGEVTVEGAPRDTQLAPGESVPSFTAPELFGGTVDWNDYAGAPAVLSVWAPWCPHCQVELPVLDGVMKDHAGVGFVTITTAVDAQPGPTPEEYMQENELDFPVAVDDATGTLASAFGIQVFPTLYFVNSDGTVDAALTGEVDEATLQATIDALA